MTQTADTLGRLGAEDPGSIKPLLLLKVAIGPEAKKGPCTALGWEKLSIVEPYPDAHGMVPLQVDEELVFDVLVGDATKSDLWSEILTKFLEDEMSEHLQTDRYEQTEKGTGYRHGAYERQLTTPLGPVSVAMPRCDDRSFSTTVVDGPQVPKNGRVLLMTGGGAK